MQMVARLTPSSRAMEETVLSGRVSRSRAWRICPAVMAGGRPRRTPRVCQDIPAGAKFETFLFVDRVLGLELPSDIGR